MVSRITEALSSWLVIAAGSGSSFPSSKNSRFSFSLLFLAAFLLLCSFVMLGPGGTLPPLPPPPLSALPGVGSREERKLEGGNKGR